MTVITVVICGDVRTGKGGGDGWTVTDGQPLVRTRAVFAELSRGV
ncbi:MAG: hypothetical protein ACM3ZF_00805 [Mycobacterium leprae]